MESNAELNAMKEFKNYIKPFLVGIVELVKYFPHDYFEVLVSLTTNNPHLEF